VETDTLGKWFDIFSLVKPRLNVKAKKL
jgi:hypothetical protein